MNLLSKIVADIKSQRSTAQQVVSYYLNKITKYDQSIHSITRILKQRAIEQAKKIDIAIQNGQDPGSLAGVPFGAKDLFDIKNEITTAGSMVLANNPPATHDAMIVQKLCKAGAIPIATLNMDEFAYGFVTENKHYGTTRNPHDTNRFSGGSSGGSAASVGAGILPFSLGSDTNGSIRVPASFCGIWGIRPTYNSISLQGVFPFAHSFDTIGPFCQSLQDLKQVFQSIITPRIIKDISLNNLRVASLGGWFEQDVDQDTLDTIEKIKSLFNQDTTIELPHIQQVRTASFLMTASEGGALHLPIIKKHALQYDPATRDRLIAGSLIASATYFKAMKIQKWFQNYMQTIFDQYDILIAPSTASYAPRIDHPFVKVNNQEVSARVNLGIYTQPISMIGCPVLSIPLNLPNSLPKGLQIITKHHNEDLLFVVGKELENCGIAKASITYSD